MCVSSLIVLLLSIIAAAPAAVAANTHSPSTSRATYTETFSVTLSDTSSKSNSGQYASWTKSVTPTVTDYDSVTSSHTDTLTFLFTNSKSASDSSSFSAAIGTQTKTLTLSSDDTKTGSPSVMTLTLIVSLSKDTSSPSRTVTDTWTEAYSRSQSHTGTRSRTLTPSPSDTATLTINEHVSHTLSFSESREVTMTLTATSSQALSVTMSRPSPSTTRSTTPTYSITQSKSQGTSDVSSSRSLSEDGTKSRTITPPPTPSPTFSPAAHSKSLSLSATAQASVTWRSYTISKTVLSLRHTTSVLLTPSHDTITISNTSTVTNTTTPPRTPSATNSVTSASTETLTLSQSFDMGSVSISESSDTTVTWTHTLTEEVTDSATFTEGSSTGTVTAVANTVSKTKTISASLIQYDVPSNFITSSQHTLRLSGESWKNVLPADETRVKAAVQYDIAKALNLGTSQVDVQGVTAGSLIVYVLISRRRDQTISDTLINYYLNTTSYNITANLYRLHGYTDSVVVLSIITSPPVEPTSLACGNTCVIAVTAVLVPLMLIAIAAFVYFRSRRWKERRHQDKLQRRRERRFKRAFGSEPRAWYSTEPTFEQEASINVDDSTSSGSSEFEETEEEENSKNDDKSGLGDRLPPTATKPPQPEFDASVPRHTDDGAGFGSLSSTPIGWNEVVSPRGIPATRPSMHSSSSPPDVFKPHDEEDRDGNLYEGGGGHSGGQAELSFGSIPLTEGILDAHDRAHTPPMRSPGTPRREHLKAVERQRRLGMMEQDAGFSVEDLTDIEEEEPLRAPANKPQPKTQMIAAVDGDGDDDSAGEEYEYEYVLLDEEEAAKEKERQRVMPPSSTPLGGAKNVTRQQTAVAPPPRRVVPPAVVPRGTVADTLIALGDLPLVDSHRSVSEQPQLLQQQAKLPAATQLTAEKSMRRSAALTPDLLPKTAVTFDFEAWEREIHFPTSAPPVAPAAAAVDVAPPPSSAPVVIPKPPAKKLTKMERQQHTKEVANLLPEMEEGGDSAATESVDVAAIITIHAEDERNARRQLRLQRSAPQSSSSHANENVDVPLVDVLLDDAHDDDLSSAGFGRSQSLPPPVITQGASGNVTAAVDVQNGDTPDMTSKKGFSGIRKALSGVLNGLLSKPKASPAAEEKTHDSGGSKQDSPAAAASQPTTTTSREVLLSMFPPAPPPPPPRTDRTPPAPPSTAAPPKSRQSVPVPVIRSPPPAPQSDPDLTPMIEPLKLMSPKPLQQNSSNNPLLMSPMVQPLPPALAGTTVARPPVIASSADSDTSSTPQIHSLDDASLPGLFSPKPLTLEPSVQSPATVSPSSSTRRSSSRDKSKRKSRRQRPPVGEDDLFAIVTVDRSGSGGRKDRGGASDAESNSPPPSSRGPPQRTVSFKMSHEE